MNGIIDIIRNLKNSASNQYEGDIVEFLIDFIYPSVELVYANMPLNFYQKISINC